MDARDHVHQYAAADSEEPDRIGGVGGPEPDGLTPLGPLALARSAVDRATMLREDAAWLAAAWADPRSLVLVVQDGLAQVRFEAGEATLVLVPPAAAPGGIRLLLGTDSSGAAYFGIAVNGPRPATAAEPAESGAGPPPAQWAGLRQAGALLSARDAGLMTHAVALANWHAIAGHCAQCGAATKPAAAGHSRRCVAYGTEHFPRSDPAVIMLVTDPDDRGLLARNVLWPERRFSVLAGFVEPGESAEQAVAREVLEETGIAVAGVRYVGSQPWPMPHSLMLGFRAHAAAGQQITVDAQEIAEARWFSRAELRAAIESREVRLPPPVSIAHQIIVSWYGSDLSGGW